MPISFFALRYSFVCPQQDCSDQFEIPLGELLNTNQVSCPKCSTSIDIQQSKTSGDLAQIFNQVVSSKPKQP